MAPSQLISSPNQTLRFRLRTWSSARESHPALLHVGQAWSLAYSPTKMAAGVGFAPTSRRLTGGCSTVELPGNGGRTRIRTVISSVWERCPDCWTIRPKLALVIGLAPTSPASRAGAPLTGPRT
jgi:hypothetical protein